MRIGYLINRYPAVSHSFIRREILALERQGHEVLRISVRGWNEAIQGKEDELERTRTRYVLQGGPVPLLFAFMHVVLTRPLQFLEALKLTWRVSRRSDRSLALHMIYLLEACQVALWLQAEKIEHLHAHFGTNSAEVAMLAHELGGPKWSFTAHGPEEFDKPEFVALPEKIRRAAFVAGVSSFGRSQLFRNTAHQDWQKVKVVHCGIEPAFYQTASEQPGSPIRLVCVGRLCEQKGQLLLIDAALQLRERGTNFELVLAGDGEMREELEAVISSYNLKDMVRITGWISSDQVRDELLAARALVLPSFAEGLPVVIMEAMALKRPVISTYVAGIPELIEPGQHGWLVPAGDVETLASAIQSCLDSSPESIALMGEAAHSRVLERHHVDQEAGKLIELFRNS
ncbi:MULTISPECIES: glycosyltransferase [Bradyrhizobium]|uniref:Glycosyltransferase involved in cell wall bisynthesis n=2 Tax=Bradyrhizobium TaxID=374 RepID=A0ABY0Q7G6_9BRAD|nr:MULTISPECIES: glycosyltransferase [Bradyrhizobium]SDJ64663.1 Glycosyltransferase involved in cell wall bisynthesis [Bradyrhizobium ottawaense]SEC31823.1 Glycosyltransferase involved in cell wall bisynthesis [Bradyrhizobium lablabi]